MSDIAGPWEAEQLSEQATENERPWIKDAKGCWIALACGNTQAESIANAQAIALLPELVAEVSFLLDRLDEFGREITDDELGTEYYGHVGPPAQRARSILSRLEEAK